MGEASPPFFQKNAIASPHVDQSLDIEALVIAQPGQAFNPGTKDLLATDFGYGREKDFRPVAGRFRLAVKRLEGGDVRPWALVQGTTVLALAVGKPDLVKVVIDLRNIVSNMNAAETDCKL